MRLRRSGPLAPARVHCRDCHNHKKSRAATPAELIAAVAEFAALKGELEGGKFNSAQAFAAKDSLAATVTALELYGSAQKRGEYPDAKSRALVDSAQKRGEYPEVAGARGLYGSAQKRGEYPDAKSRALVDAQKWGEYPVAKSQALMDDAKKFEASINALAAAAKAGDKAAALRSYGDAAEALSKYLAGAELDPIGSPYYSHGGCAAYRQRRRSKRQAHRGSVLQRRGRRSAMVMQAAPDIKPSVPVGNPALRRRLTLRLDQGDAGDSKANEAELESFKVRVRSVFQDLDQDGDGLVRREEMRAALKLMELPASPEHIHSMFDLIDENNDGAIHYEEFEATIPSELAPGAYAYAQYALSRHQALTRAFRSLDSNGDGLITQDDIRRALRRLDVHASDGEILKLMQRADLNSDGHICLSEWQEFLLLCTAGSIEKVFDYWAHASAIDIGETLAAPDNFQACAFAGVVSRTATAPMDRLKNRDSVNRQAQAPMDRRKVLLQAGTERGTIMGGLRGIWAEGGWRAFWRGNGANVIKIMPESAIRFMGYDFFKKRISKDPDEVTIIERFIAGALAGCTGQILIYPLEISKTRLAVARSGEFAGIFDCVAKTVATGGWQGLYRGLGTSVLGVIPYAGVDLAIFYTLRSQWMAAHPGSDEARAQGVRGPSLSAALPYMPPPAYTLYLSGVRGPSLSAAPPTGVRGPSLSAAPPTVGRVPARPPAANKYTGMVDCFQQVVRGQGIKGLYRGLGPNFLKALPAIAISYAVYEKSRQGLNRVFNVQRGGGSRQGLDRVFNVQRRVAAALPIACAAGGGGGGGDGGSGGGGGGSSCAVYAKSCQGLNRVFNAQRGGG
ncbi:mitochondrial carrier domain-containing protein [Tribonema minus]|uniref:Mitochondrial carrier domain-containing protein n=1 Tax=Tribonema minus TaxID=303371 RepID=A0A835Z3Z5_9STRA|nr:mitochondrial carrier domain-containing protein [Tribonema minus]